jgi:hypothetical protein
MKLSNKYVFILLSAALMACGGKKENDETAEGKGAPAEKAEVCTYSYDNASTMVQWTAYKFTEKAAVQGKFDSVLVSGTTASEDPLKVIEGAAFEIKTASLQTNDAEKNGNIISAFFGKMLNTASITGTVKTIGDGKATIAVKMNDVEKDVEGTVTWEEDKIGFNAEINLDDWKGQDAIKSLNEKCKKNHTGTDGKLLVWPTITLFVQTTLKKECK